MTTKVYLIGGSRDREYVLLDQELLNSGVIKYGLETYYIRSLNNHANLMFFVALTRDQMKLYTNNVEQQLNRYFNILITHPLGDQNAKSNRKKTNKRNKAKNKKQMD